jgi:hypothetical protein
MIYSLVPHPDHRPVAVESVSVRAERYPEGRLWLEYAVRGTKALVFPAQRAPERQDGLWKTTCFELFFRPDGGARYLEFNFSPSSAWAAYGFHDYRAGMHALAADDPEIEIFLDADPWFFLVAEPWPAHLLSGTGALALTAVIEEVGGVKSYWSLAHPPGAPDFHHPACFAARLPAPA